MIEIDLRQFQNLLFKSKTNKGVAEILNALGVEFTISDYPDTYYQIYESLGVELTFNKEHYLLSLIFHQKSTQFIKLIGPFDLDPSLRMKDIEAKLGFPERTGGGSKTMDYWASYPDKGISVTYQTKEKDDLEAPIHHIIFFQAEDELSRIRFITKSEVHIYFQVRSSKYSANLIADLLQLDPDRIDENTANLYEIYLTRNRHLTMKTQLKEVMSFLDAMSQRIRLLPDHVHLSLKINVISFRSNAVKFKLLTEHIKRLEDLGIEVEYEFMT